MGKGEKMYAMIKRLLSFGLCGFVLLGCGSSGETSAPATVSISGIVTYTHFKADQTGLQYNSPTEKPIRGAIIELWDSNGVVLKSGNTTETGAYSFTAPINTTVRVVVGAALGSSVPHVKVVDNTSGGALYALFLDITTGTSDIAQSFSANSGWDGTSYSGIRASAPFAILDTIYQAEKLITDADSAVVFPELTVNWSKNNKPTDGDKLLGEIGTSHYIAGSLYILGAEDLDTDEYDSSVIAHEWSHYFEDKLSRSDSIGGDHAEGDILDPRLAFGEGFGNAFSGMVFGDPIYIDTNGTSQAALALSMDLEADSILDSNVDGNGTTLDGFYSESSIQEVLYDLFDSGASDDDNLSLGFKPIYDAMVGGHKTTPAFTSIFSFLKNLKDANSGVNTEITTLAAAENIGNGDAFESLASPIYTPVPVDGSVVNTDVDGFGLQTWVIYGPITANDPGNKLFNRMFFKFSIPSSGNYTIEVTPTGGGDMFFVLNEKGITTEIDGFTAGGKESVTKSLSAGVHSMTVGSFGGAAPFTVSIF